jgi:hypothetical protein
VANKTIPVIGAKIYTSNPVEFENKIVFALNRLFEGVGHEFSTNQLGHQYQHIVFSNNVLKIFFCL